MPRETPSKDEKEEHVLKNAHDTFIRFGYRRTTMSDLATAAGMSRQTLYLMYSNKEDIFRGVIRRYCAKMEQLGAKRVQRAGTVEEKLGALMKTWVVDPFVELNRSPEAGEIYEAGYTFAKDLRVRFTAVYTAQIESVLELPGTVDHTKLESLGLRVSRIAHLLAQSTMGLKREITDRRELESMLTDIRTWHLAMLK